MEGEREAALARMRAAEAPAIELVTDPAPARPRSVALVSGSFDPVTVAHVGLAEAALASSEWVLFVYSVRTLPKEGRSGEHGPLLSETERLDALAKVCARHPRFAVAVCSRGLLVDQVEAAADTFPGAELSLVVGSDKLLQLFDPRWYEDRDSAITRLLDRAGIRYSVRRGDAEAVDALLRGNLVPPWRDRFELLGATGPIADHSSSRVRDLVRRGSDVSDLVPEEAWPIVRAAASSIRFGDDSGAN